MMKANQLQNILMVSDDFFPAATGVGVHLQIICKELVQQGHHVVVMTSKQGDQKNEETWEGVEVHRFTSLNIAGFYQAFPSLSRVKKIIQNNKIEIVHFHYLSWMLILVNFALRNLEIKKIYTYHMNEYVLTQPWFMRPFRGLIRRGIIYFCNSVEKIICPSDKLKIQIQNLGVKTPIHFITNPLSTDFFQKRKTFELRESPFQILFAGRLNPEKNIPLLLKSFARHLQKFPKSKLWIAGKGDQEGQLKKLAVKLAIQNSVDFLGFMSHDKLSTYYNSCDIFVLPSTIETQGLVAMEAMSFSKPVIVTKEIVSAEELVDHDGNGFIVDAFNPNELASKLNHLASDPSLRLRLGSAGLRKIKEYDPKLVARQLLEIYGGEKQRPQVIALAEEHP
jgi:1,2-diacylglycerol 3-alpha-glucosyltransferase